MTRSNVVLPQPLGPIGETKSPGSTVRSTSASAVTAASPASKTRLSLRISTAGGGLPAAMVTAGRATTTSTIDHPAAACLSIARSSTLQPAARSAGSALSTSLWLMPSAQGTKTMPTGATRLM